MFNPETMKTFGGHQDNSRLTGFQTEGVQCLLVSQHFNVPLLQKAKQYYDFGEDEEFQCYTGFDLEGFQFINCLPDGTWTQPTGQCLRECW